MHFVGIKCEICNKLENTRNDIDNLPEGWLALVQRAPWFSTARHTSLHFCSFECLRSWINKKEQEA